MTTSIIYKGYEIILDFKHAYWVVKKNGVELKPKFVELNYVKEWIDSETP